ncbi:MAG: hypothetical protein GX241_03275 [Ruminococcaceae bacterium]|nr:hypothetical protein [Oscillospiraceae bacterium]
MKKFISVILALAILFSFAACKKSGDDVINNKKDTGENTEKESTSIEKEDPNVTITVPDSFFEDQNIEEIVAKTSEEEGFISATINEDGSVTFVMTKEKYQEQLQKYKESVDEGIDSITKGKDAPGTFSKIEYKEDYTEFTIYTTDKYTKDDPMLLTKIFQVGLHGQIINGKDKDKINVKIMIIKESTGDVLLETTYKDWLAKKAADEKAQK